MVNKANKVNKVNTANKIKYLTASMLAVPIAMNKLTINTDPQILSLLG